MINIYVFFVFKGEITTPGAAYLPGYRPNVYLTALAENPSVLIHEMGHFFGLLHTFPSPFGQKEFVSRTASWANCEDVTDFLCDTEADPYSLPLNEFCETISSPKDAHGDFYLAPTDNVMSYYSSDCVSIFTPGQYSQIIYNYNLYFKLFK